MKLSKSGAFGRLFDLFRPCRSPGLVRATDNHPMRIRFTKMQGAGNDFIMLDETRRLLGLSTAQLELATGNRATRLPAEFAELVLPQAPAGS